MLYGGMLALAMHAGLARADLAVVLDFDIPAQPLATALTRFSELTQIQVVTAAQDLQALQSPGFGRRATAAEALTELLRGTALQFQVIGSDTVVVAQRDDSAAEPLDESRLLDTIIIIGRGHTRASNTVVPQEIAGKAPGVAVQAFFGNLPGINVQMSDPFGLYEFGNSVRIRGFGSEQVGISLDGVPLESYDLRDGSPPSRFVDTEDLASLTVAQGSGDVTMPSYHALGGSVRYFTSTPLGAWNAVLSNTVGANELTRLYAHLDTPAWWHGGPIASFSGSRTRAVQFDNRRAGMDVEHGSVQLEQALQGGRLRLSYRYGNRDDHDMQTYDARGHVNPFFDLRPELSGDPELDALHYEMWTNGREDQLLSLLVQRELTSNLSVELLPYYERKQGYGLGGVAPSSAQSLYAAATAADTGVPDRADIAPYDGRGITARRETLSGNRGGATFKLSWSAETHTLQLGGWYERYRFSQRRPLFNVDDDGALQTEGAPIIVYYDRDFDTRVTQLYLGDSSRWLGGALTVDAGFKGLHVERHFEGLPNTRAFNTQTHADLTRVDRDPFQPQLGLTWKLGSHEELFANYAENFSAVPRNAVGSVAYASDLRPETSRNIDLGLRSVREQLSGSLALYHIRYAQRIFELTVIDPFLVGEEAYRNVGGVETYGAELALYWSPLRRLRIGSTLSLNRSRFRDDYQTYDGDQQQLVVVAVKDRSVPDTPELMAGVDALYSADRWSMGGAMKYTGRRYSTAANDERVDGYATADLNLGYQLLRFRQAPGGVRLQLNLYNVFDERYVGFISPSEYTDNEQRGSFYLGLRRSLYLTLSANFL